MTRPIRATISLAAMQANLARVRALAPRSRVWAVVKANAYGHGIERARAAFADADGLALLEFDAALALRESGWRRPVLMLEGAFDAGDVGLAAAHRLALAVHCREQIDLIAAAESGAALDVHLKLNSGMNRLGFALSDAAPVHARLVALPQVRSVTLMTHFANADAAGGAEPALAAFDAATASLAGERSVANDSRRDWVRPGIMLYGATPFADRSAAALGLRAAMRLQSQVIAVQSLRPGDTVGYGASFVARAPMRIGIVACGYADGYPRHAPSGTPVAVDGVRTGTCGRVSMDMLAVDLTALPQSGIGSAVELWGERIPVDEVAQSAGTIGYELLCALAPRVPVAAVDS
jgi:alanine racemase